MARLPATIRAATRTASIRLAVSALPLPGDVEGGPVGHAGPDDRQAERDVHGAVEADRLDGDVPLVVVHGDHGVELAAEGAGEQGVGGDRALTTSTPAAGARATAGPMIVRSSSPNRPFSPAWGFRPATATRGGRPPVRGRRASSARRILASTESTVRRSKTRGARRAAWRGARPGPAVASPRGRRGRASSRARAPRNARRGSRYGRDAAPPPAWSDSLLSGRVVIASTRPSRARSMAAIRKSAAARPGPGVDHAGRGPREVLAGRVEAGDRRGRSGRPARAGRSAGPSAPGARAGPPPGGAWPSRRRRTGGPASAERLAGPGPGDQLGADARHVPHRQGHQGPVVGHGCASLRSKESMTLDVPTVQGGVGPPARRAALVNRFRRVGPARRDKPGPFGLAATREGQKDEASGQFVSSIDLLRPIMAGSPRPVNPGPPSPPEPIGTPIRGDIRSTEAKPNRDRMTRIGGSRDDRLRVFVDFSRQPAHRD